MTEAQVILEKLTKIEQILATETKKTMTIAQYARHSGIGEHRIREMIGNKRLNFPYFKVGVKTVINVRLADELIEQLSLSNGKDASHCGV